MRRGFSFRFATSYILIDQSGDILRILTESESSVRKLAQKKGFRVSKSRQGEHLKNRGQYQLIDNCMNAVILGSGYDASLTEMYLRAN